MIKLKPQTKTVTRDTTRDTVNNAAAKRTHADRQRAYRQRLKKRRDSGKPNTLSAYAMGQLGMGT